MIEEIPDYVIRKAELPVDSPDWFSLDGEEYSSTTILGKWVITNMKLGPNRLRTISRVAKEVYVQNRVD
mgnify:CR=1 FL=1